MLTSTLALVALSQPVAPAPIDCNLLQTSLNAAYAASQTSNHAAACEGEKRFLELAGMPQNRDSCPDTVPDQRYVEMSYRAYQVTCEGLPPDQVTPLPPIR